MTRDLFADASSRRLAGTSAALLTVTLLAAACTAETPAAEPTPSDVPDAGVAQIVTAAMEHHQLRSVLVEVTKDGETLSRQAFGESMTGSPATTDMHFRNGAVAFAYVGTLLMLYVDEGVVTLDDTIDRWEPALPEADVVTLRMLANQTSGYPDFETDAAWTATFNADPFHEFTYEERLEAALARPVQFAPGTNWSYAHTNFMILGEILAEIGGAPLDTLLREKVLEPMGLDDTTASEGSAIPAPVLHTFSSERRAALGIPADVPFTEEATFWNTQWGTPMGANQTTTIDDLTTTAIQVGSGALLSSSSFGEMTDPLLIGFGEREEACAPSCFPQSVRYSYGLGVVRSGEWILQNPSLSGLSATTAYLPSERISIAVVVTFEPGAFDASGNYQPYQSTQLFQELGAHFAPDHAPPT
ncbi:serine hydrolase domain-containing protein [Microbacterium aoyamense]|uniref:Serine hydrolase domain-containing protein n=1 Tax=Microbacterium aoyamense TaxID=344166 RepID=A0ABP5ARG4_9MICO|nr:serine hydrolase domain-containing protein [Microbacterium aoyamense]